MVKNLLLFNGAIFLLNEFFPIINHILALKDFSADTFFPTQIVTCMFVHYGFMHLFGNMLSLYTFGTVLENYWGSKRFLIFYLICGVGGALIYSGVHHYEVVQLKDIYNQYSVSHSFNDLKAFERACNFDIFNSQLEELADNDPENSELISVVKNEMVDMIKAAMYTGMGGASGAVFGILMAFALLFPNTELMLLFFPFPIKAKYFVMIYAFMELSLGVIKLPGDNVAHFAHLGGALFGFIIVKYWQKQRNTFY